VGHDAFNLELNMETEPWSLFGDDKEEKRTFFSIVSHLFLTCEDERRLRGLGAALPITREVVGILEPRAFLARPFKRSDLSTCWTSTPVPDTTMLAVDDRASSGTGGTGFNFFCLPSLPEIGLCC
jgi:hypothetical protein